MRVLEYGKNDMNAVFNRKGVPVIQAREAVRGIIESVRAEGDKALLEYTRRFDHVELRTIRVSDEEMTAAFERIDPKVATAIRFAHKNITALHKAQYRKINRQWMTEIAPGVKVGERIAPIDSVGCYVPGGLAAYPSTVLMNIVPAKVAGVKRTVVVSPPKNMSDSVLAACRIARVNEVYRVGGAQAIAALAYGTESIKPVSKIVGPGNQYVVSAKLMVFGKVGIDSPAGPSEILIIADDSADPSYIASDILAQAEHSADAQCVLTTTSRRLANEAMRLVSELAQASERKDIISSSLENFSVVLTRNLSESIDFANQYAPEHLEILTNYADAVSKEIRNAGAIFIGPFSPVAAGDYASGGNHVLPTGGAAKFSGQLSVRDFLKSTSIQKISKAGLKRIAPTITTLAELEGLNEHRRSVEARLEDQTSATESGFRPLKKQSLS
ncbi:MAG: histidinol dehydrogenase [Candidatus Altiarchaeota archaeon]